MGGIVWRVNECQKIQGKAEHLLWFYSKKDRRKFQWRLRMTNYEYKVLCKVKYGKLSGVDQANYSYFMQYVWEPGIWVIYQKSRWTQWLCLCTQDMVFQVNIITIWELFYLAQKVWYRVWLSNESNVVSSSRRKWRTETELIP